MNTILDLPKNFNCGTVYAVVLNEAVVYESMTTQSKKEVLDLVNLLTGRTGEPGLCFGYETTQIAHACEVVRGRFLCVKGDDHTITNPIRQHAREVLKNIRDSGDDDEENKWRQNFDEWLFCKAKKAFPKEALSNNGFFISIKPPKETERFSIYNLLL